MIIINNVYAISNQILWLCKYFVTYKYDHHLYHVSLIALNYHYASRYKPYFLYVN